MTLLGSVEKLQNQGSQFFTDVAQVFSENSLIRDIWLSMAQDLKQQVESLQSLPRSFWSQLKDEEVRLKEAVQNCWRPQPAQDDPDRTLRHFLCVSLEFEEPLILSVYVPLIRQLRTGWSGEELGLYIMVKAHVSRLLQVIRSFSGDPVSIHRVVSLFAVFEKQVQVPPEPIAERPKRAAVASAASETKKPRPERKQSRKESPRSRTRGKRAVPKTREALLKVPRRAQR